MRDLYIKLGSKNITEAVPVKYFKRLSQLEFYNMKFNVPEKKEEYLAYRYGKDWVIPKKEWITERDDGSVIKK